MKKEKLQQMRQKVTNLFKKHEMLIVPAGFLIAATATFAIWETSRAISDMIGNPDLDTTIAIVLLIVIIIVAIAYERHSKRKGKKLGDHRSTSGKTE